MKWGCCGGGAPHLLSQELQGAWWRFGRICVFWGIWRALGCQRVSGGIVVKGAGEVRMSEGVWECWDA